MQEYDNRNNEADAAAAATKPIFLEKEERIEKIQVEKAAQPLKHVWSDGLRQVRVLVGWAAALPRRLHDGVSARDELDSHSHPCLHLLEIGMGAGHPETILPHAATALRGFQAKRLQVELRLADGVVRSDEVKIPNLRVLREQSRGDLAVWLFWSQGVSMRIVRSSGMLEVKKWACV